MNSVNQTSHHTYDVMFEIMMQQSKSINNHCCKIFNVSTVNSEYLENVKQLLVIIITMMLDVEGEFMQNLCCSTMCCILSSIACTFDAQYFIHEENVRLKGWEEWKWKMMFAEKKLVVDCFMQSLRDDLQKFQLRVPSIKQLEAGVHVQKSKLLGQCYNFVMVMEKFDVAYQMWERLKLFISFSSTHAYCMSRIDLQRENFVELCQHEKLLTVSIRLCVMGELLNSWFDCWLVKRNDGKNVLGESDQESATILNWLQDFHAMLVNVVTITKGVKEQEGTIMYIDTQIQSMCQVISRLRFMIYLIHDYNTSVSY